MCCVDKEHLVGSQQITALIKFGRQHFYFFIIFPIPFERNGWDVLLNRYASNYLHILYQQQTPKILRKNTTAHATTMKRNITREWVEIFLMLLSCQLFYWFFFLPLMDYGIKRFNFMSCHNMIISILPLTYHEHLTSE